MTVLAVCKLGFHHPPDLFNRVQFGMIGRCSQDVAALVPPSQLVESLPVQGLDTAHREQVSAAKPCRGCHGPSASVATRPFCGEVEETCPQSRGCDRVHY